MGVTCPTCRGGRLLRLDTVSIGYRVCDDCCDYTGEFTATGAPKFTRNFQREAATIRNYRMGRAA